MQLYEVDEFGMIMILILYIQLIISSIWLNMCSVVVIDK